MKTLNNRKENKILARARAPPHNASIFSRAVFFTATTVSSPSVQTVEPRFLTQMWMDFRNSSSTRTSTKFRTSRIAWQVAKADGDPSIRSQRSRCEDDARSRFFPQICAKKRVRQRCDKKTTVPIEAILTVEIFPTAPFAESQPFKTTH